MAWVCQRYSSLFLSFFLSVESSMEFSGSTLIVYSYETGIVGSRKNPMIGAELKTGKDLFGSRNDPILRSIKSEKTVLDFIDETNYSNEWLDQTGLSHMRAKRPKRRKTLRFWYVERGNEDLPRSSSRNSIFMSAGLYEVNAATNKSFWGFRLIRC